MTALAALLIVLTLLALAALGIAALGRVIAELLRRPRATPTANPTISIPSLWTDDALYSPPAETITDAAGKDVWYVGSEDGLRKFFSG